MRRARPEFSTWLASQDAVAIDEIGTRALVRRIREGAVIRCALGEAPAGRQTAAEAYARVLRAAGRGCAGGSAGPSLQKLEKTV